MDTPRFSQIMRFLSSGVFGTLLYYTILYTLTEYAGVLYVYSAIVAGILNWCSNFAFHKLWTFGKRDIAGTHIEMGRYLVLVGILLSLNTSLLYALVEFFDLWYIAAQLLVTVVITIISFIFTRKIFN